MWAVSNTPTRRAKTSPKGVRKAISSSGGSSIVTLFEPERLCLSADLTEHSEKGLEVYARVGDIMGTSPSQQDLS